jgi:hypothetical protein
MNSLILLAAIAGVPVLLALFLRVSAVYLFLSTAAGSLLVNYVGDDASLALGMMVRGQNTNLIAQFGLLFLPVVLSLLFLRKTMPKSKLLLHIVPLLATGLTIAVLALPFFDSNAQSQIYADRYGDMFKDSQDVIVGGTSILILLLTWLTLKHKEDKKHKKHHK